MIWLYLYLAIGAVAAFIACFTPPARRASATEFVVVALIFMLFWPACFLGKYLQRLTKDADGNH